MYLLRTAVWGLVAVAALAGATPPVRADALSAVQVLREGGCGGVMPRAQPLRHDTLLDRAAAQWSQGTPLRSAAVHSGFPPQSVIGVRIRGPDTAAIQLLRRSSCLEVTDQSLREMGAYRVGAEAWIVLASAYPSPALNGLQARIQTPIASSPSPPSQTALERTPPATAALAPRALQLVNDVRARGTRCGDRVFAPVQPVTLSLTLTDAASAHALDMAEHNYFEHVDLAGQSPADRVRSVGYHEKLVGENIAYGPKTVDEVVQGWLDSPGHCENIMDPRFAEMGIAVAPGRSTRRGLFWVQVLAEPRA